MKCDRLNLDLLVRAIDNELSSAEAEWVPTHIAECSVCSQQRQSMESVSLDIKNFVNRAYVVERIGDRQQLVGLKTSRQAPDRVMRRFGWGMAIAATLAVGIVVAPRHTVPDTAPVRAQAQTGVSNAIEIDGETFVSLPYSNPDLPLSAPRIVQMQVPVSSLADIGLGAAQSASELSNQDRTVLADVLMGADGQPLGVHVVSWE